jgi:Transposase DDE domain
LITEHGRATPLVWLTVNKAELKDRRSLYERRVLVRLAEIVPAGVGVCIVADRGFGDQNLYRLLTEELHFEYVIRFRGNIKVTTASGVTHTAAAWVSPSGRARVLRGAMVTADRYPVGTVVCVRDPEMKQAWCLAASSTEATAKDLTGYYGSRWGIDIDQAWRLSRIKGCVVGIPHRRGQSAPGRRRCPDPFQVGDRSGIGRDQFGRAGAGFDRAAEQTSGLHPVVERWLRYTKFFSQFADRPFIRLSLWNRPRPA